MCKIGSKRSTIATFIGNSGSNWIGGEGDSSHSDLPEFGWLTVGRLFKLLGVLTAMSQHEPLGPGFWYREQGKVVAYPHFFFWKEVFG